MITELTQPLREIAVIELAFSPTATGPRLIHTEDNSRQYAINLLPSLQQEWLDTGAEWFTFTEQHCVNLLGLVDKTINPRVALQPVLISLIEALISRQLTVSEVATFIECFSNLYEHRSNNPTLQDLINALPDTGNGAPALASQLKALLDSGDTAVLSGSNSYVNLIAEAIKFPRVSLCTEGNPLLVIQVLEQLWWWIASKAQANSSSSNRYELTIYGLLATLNRYNSAFAYDYLSLWFKRVIAQPSLVLMLQEPTLPNKSSDLGNLLDSSPLVKRKFLEKIVTDQPDGPPPDRG